MLFVADPKKKNFATNYITIIIIQQRMNEWMNWPATSNAVHTHTHTHINMYVQQNIVIQTRIRNWKTNETKKNPLDAHPNNISKKKWLNTLLFLSYFITIFSSFVFFWPVLLLAHPQYWNFFLFYKFR